MRYIGSKDRVIPFIRDTIQNVVGDISGATVGDLFSGTVCVAKLMKSNGAELITNDYMAFSYALQMAYINNNSMPEFSQLIERYGFSSYQDVLTYLNGLHNITGFFNYEYSLEGSKNNEFQRNYFSQSNAIRIDSIRTMIQDWRDNNLINENEFYVILASLIDAVTKVSNISGTFGAFLKVDDKRKNNDLKLDPIEVIESCNTHHCYNDDIFNIIEQVEGDILYLDPPYNGRQYPPYYHILETVTLYDNPAIYGKTGRRPYTDKISAFCIKGEVSNAIESIIRRAKFEHVFLSYSTDGLLTRDDIYSLLSDIGRTEVFEENYKRYKSNSNGEEKSILKELIFYVRK